MRESTIEAYAEVSSILDLMDETYVKQIPEKLRNIFKENALKTNRKEILSDVPLEQQNLNKETLGILAVLNYNYWCKDENRKKELLELYSENERKYQRELREKYNPDNIFRDKYSNKEEVISENVAMVEYKESIFTKIKNWLKQIFNR